MIDVFLEQMVEVRQLLRKVCGVVSVMSKGLEADDLMYHAAQLLDVDTKTILTGDKDMYQAVANDKTGRTQSLVRILRNTRMGCLWSRGWTTGPWLVIVLMVIPVLWGWAQ
jgi:hypothetical protein